MFSAARCQFCPSSTVSRLAPHVCGCCGHDNGRPTFSSAAEHEESAPGYRSSSEQSYGLELLRIDAPHTCRSRATGAPTCQGGW
jgi:hypothetical protein